MAYGLFKDMKKMLSCLSNCQYTSVPEQVDDINPFSYKYRNVRTKNEFLIVR